MPGYRCQEAFLVTCILTPDAGVCQPAVNFPLWVREESGGRFQAFWKEPKYRQAMSESKAHGTDKPKAGAKTSLAFQWTPPVFVP